MERKKSAEEKGRGIRRTSRSVYLYYWKIDDLQCNDIRADMHLHRRTLWKQLGRAPLNNRKTLMLSSVTTTFCPNILVFPNIFNKSTPVCIFDTY